GKRPARRSASRAHHRAREAVRRLNSEHAPQRQGLRPWLTDAAPTGSRREAQPMTGQEESPERGGTQEPGVKPLAILVTCALLMVQCLSVASWVHSYQIADEDTAEAVRLARTCIELGQCTSMGTTASGLGLHHGASWIRLTGHFLRSGGGLASLQATAM